MVFDRTKSYTYEDVESGEITYSENILSDALDILSLVTEIPRSEIAEYILNTYGGSFENAIIMAFINTDWKKLAKLD